MIIWKGWGIMAAVLFFAGLITPGMIAQGLDYGESAQAWMTTAGVILAGILIFVLNHLLTEVNGDDDTDHTLFFIPIKWWSYAIVALGLFWSMALLFHSLK